MGKPEQPTPESVKEKDDSFFVGEAQRISHAALTVLGKEGEITLDEDLRLFISGDAPVALKRVLLDNISGSARLWQHRDLANHLREKFKKELFKGDDVAAILTAQDLAEINRFLDPATKELTVSGKELIGEIENYLREIDKEG